MSDVSLDALSPRPDLPRSSSQVFLDLRRRRRRGRSAAAWGRRSLALARGEQKEGRRDGEAPRGIFVGNKLGGRRAHRRLRALPPRWTPRGQPFHRMAARNDAPTEGKQVHGSAPRSSSAQLFLSNPNPPPMPPSPVPAACAADLAILLCTEHPLTMRLFPERPRRPPTTWPASPTSPSLSLFPEHHPILYLRRSVVAVHRSWPHQIRLRRK